MYVCIYIYIYIYICIYRYTQKYTANNPLQKASLWNVCSTKSKKND